MSSCEAEKLFGASGCNEFVYNNAQCGDTMGNRRYFRFSDSRDTFYAMDATLKHVAPAVITDATTFAGIVCVVDDPNVELFPAIGELRA